VLGPSVRLIMHDHAWSKPLYIWSADIDGDVRQDVDELVDTPVD
jgi:hypothetical protein